MGFPKTEFHHPTTHAKQSPSPAKKIHFGGSKSCRCGKRISSNKRFCLTCITQLTVMMRNGFCPICAAKIVDHHLHPRTGPEYFNWLKSMCEDDKDADSGHKMYCTAKSLVLVTGGELPEIENV